LTKLVLVSCSCPQECGLWLHQTVRKSVSRSALVAFSACAALCACLLLCQRLCSFTASLPRKWWTWRAASSPGPCVLFLAGFAWSAGAACVECVPSDVAHDGLVCQPVFSSPEWRRMSELVNASELVRPQRRVMLPPWLTIACAGGHRGTNLHDVGEHRWAHAWHAGCRGGGRSASFQTTSWSGAGDVAV